MATVASSALSYASVTDLLNRFDLRPIEELLSDTGVRLSQRGLTVSASLQAILQEASGVLEAAATAGQRYVVGPSGPPTPTAPGLTPSSDGGMLAAGTYQAVVTYVNAIGESLPSPAASATTTGTTSVLAVGSPAANLNVTGWNVYVTQPNGSSFTLQNALPLAIGSPFTLAAPPSSSGVAPPTTAPPQANDLMAIATSGTNSAQFLVGIVCAIAYAFIWDRRPEWIGGDPEKAGFRVKLAMEHLDALREGKLVFGTIEAQQAGLPQDTVETTAVLQQQKRTTHVGRALFGPRVADIVGAYPPPHTSP